MYRRLQRNVSEPLKDWYKVHWNFNRKICQFRSLSTVSTDRPDSFTALLTYLEENFEITISFNLHTTNFKLSGKTDFYNNQYCSLEVRLQYRLRHTSTYFPLPFITVTLWYYSQLLPTLIIKKGGTRDPLIGLPSSTHVTVNKFYSAIHPKSITPFSTDLTTSRILCNAK
jgi:hypothetical protein